jgi:hypothetical protein
MVAVITAMPILTYYRKRRGDINALAACGWLIPRLTESK